MTRHPIYQITSIGRPVEPQYPTNKAVIILLPVAGIVAALFAYLVSSEHSITALLGTVMYSMLVTFGAWALARELAPDDNPAAFICMVLAFLVYLLSPGSSILLLFVALALSRILNRSTGLAPRMSDSLVVTLLAGWAAYSLDSPLIAAVAALVFILDTMLAGPEKRQWPFAIFSLVIVVILTIQHGLILELPALPAAADDLLTPLVLLVFILSVVSMKTVESAGDIDGKPLLLNRVRWGMIAVLLLAAIFLFTGPGHAATAALLVATMAGIPAGGVLRNLRNLHR